MRRYARWFVLVATVMTGTASTASAQATCDRACLRTMLDQYLNAVVKHDPGAAPLVIGFRQTENAINTRPGNGVWKTVTALGRVQRRYYDATSGQAAYYGTMEEGSSTAIVTVRVRVENKQLTEAEWYVARENDPGLNGARQPGRPPANLHNPEYLTKNPPPERVVPANQRADRASLVRIVNSYFDAITSHDGSVELTHQGCGRGEKRATATKGKLPPSGMRPCGERIAGARGTIPAAGGTGIRTSGARTRSTRRGEQRLRVGTSELQRIDGGGAANSARRRRGAGGARVRHLHPPPGIADAAQRLQRMVLHRRGENSYCLRGDVLSAGGARRAELAAVRR